MIFSRITCPGGPVPCVLVSCVIPCLSLLSNQEAAFWITLYSRCICDYVVGSCSGNHLGPGAPEQLTQCGPKAWSLLTSVALEQQEGGENGQKFHPVCWNALWVHSGSPDTESLAGNCSWSPGYSVSFLAVLLDRCLLSYAYVKLLH